MAGTELIVVGGSDLVERKRKLFEGADCIIALPGGVGTLDELFEAIACVHTGLWPWMPICVVDADGYYEGVQRQLRRGGVSPWLAAARSTSLPVPPKKVPSFSMLVEQCV